MNMIVAPHRFAVSGGGAGYRYWDLNVTAGNQLGSATAATTLNIPELGFRLTPTGANQAASSASASSADGGQVAANAFDGNTATYWLSLSSDAFPQNIGADLGSNKDIKAVYVKAYSVTGAANGAPKTFTVRRSTDGISYTDEWSVSVGNWLVKGEGRLFINPTGNAGLAAWFGYDTGMGNLSSNNTSIFTGEHDASPYTNHSGVTISVTSIEIASVVSGGTVELAIYSDSAGVPGTLLGTSNQVAVAAGTNTFTFSPAVSVATGTQIWVAGRIVSGAALVCSNGSSGSVGLRYKSAAGAFTASFGGSSSFTTAIPARLDGTVV